MDHLNEKIIEDVQSRIWGLGGSLKGLGALFEQSGASIVGPSFTSDDVFGIGQLLRVLSTEASRLEDILRCGYDSMAQKENYPCTDDEGEDEEREDEPTDSSDKNHPTVT